MQANVDNGAVLKVRQPRFTHLWLVRDGRSARCQLSSSLELCAQVKLIQIAAPVRTGEGHAPHLYGKSGETPSESREVARPSH